MAPRAPNEQHKERSGPPRDRSGDNEQEMSRPIRASINIEAMRHNLERLRRAADGRTLWAVVKANAYGHGLENAVTGFAEADGLALIEVSEARRARDAGWKKRILMLEGFFEAEEVAQLEAIGVEPVVHSRRQIEMLKAGSHKNLKVHVKINSGMNRLGFAPEEAPAVIAEINAIEGVRVLDVVTHFANAELPFEAQGPASVSAQLSRMKPLLADNEACMANSAAALLHPQVGGAGIRAGIVLYGVSPDASVSSESLGLEPVMSLTAEIIAVRVVQPGQAVGYGSRWVAERPTRIAVVACGYADGYPRSMPDGSPTLVCGKIAPIAGAVSMDMLTIDVTDVPEAVEGSLVELWGPNVSVNDLACRCGTIGYELVCSLARRVPVVAV